MGLNRASISAFQFLLRGGHVLPGAKIVEIGAQQLSDSFLESEEHWADLELLCGVQGHLTLPRTRSAEKLATDLPPGLEAGAPYAKNFFEWLGFDYRCIDIDGSPDCIALDLNYDLVPESEKAKYDVVTNFGTTEHVANQVNAFRVIHDLAAIGGVMIHEVPAQGMLNHGLINYNPKFFWMLARSNGYDVLLMNFVSSGEGAGLPQNVKEYCSSFPYLDQAAGFKWASDYRTQDAGLRIIFKKVYDIPYVAPIDIGTGIEASSVALARRYWTVFTPNVFEHLPRITEQRQPLVAGLGSNRPDRRAEGGRRVSSGRPLEEYHDVFRGMAPWRGYVPKGFIANFVGMLTSVEFQPFLFADPCFDPANVGGGYVQTSLPIIGEGGSLGDAEGWFEAVNWLASAREARNRYVVITLGASYGAQAVSACLTLQQVNPLPFKLVAAEPVPQNCEWMTRQMRANGINPEDQWILPLAVSDRTDPVFFPVGAPGIGANNCYSTNEAAARQEYLECFLRNERSEEALCDLIMRNTTGIKRTLVSGLDSDCEIKLVSSMTLRELLAPFDFVDYLEADIQQSEIVVFPPFIDLLRKKVRRIHIGTHGKEVHRSLHTLFARSGWEIVFSFEPNSVHGSAFGDFEVNDGVLTVKNPDL